MPLLLALQPQPRDHGVPGPDLPRRAGPYLRPQHLPAPQWQRLVPELGRARQQQQRGLGGRAAGTRAHLPGHPGHHHGSLLRSVRRGLGGELAGHVRDHPVSAGSRRRSSWSREGGSEPVIKVGGGESIPSVQNSGDSQG